MNSESIWLYFVLLGPLLAITIILSYLFYLKRKSNKDPFPIHDERLIRISERSAMLSYFIGLFSMSVSMIGLIIAYEFMGIGDLASINLLMVELLIMAISYFAFYSYYSKRGSFD